ncbi:TcpD family membrane protein [Leuconostoc citreum]|uniref:TcpD family membrane protein n=1 Tax=Leuconostoc citreum TaxID=33964 RepID=UPI0031343315
MDFYNSIKPLLLGGTVIIAGWRALKHYGKNEGKEMWTAIGVGALVYFFVNGPQNSLQAFTGLLNSLINYLKGMGG